MQVPNHPARFLPPAAARKLTALKLMFWTFIPARPHKGLVAQGSYLIGVLGMLLAGGGPACAQPATFAGSAQHTSQYSAPAQPLNALRWTTPIDLTNSGSLAHYGAPLIT